MNDPGGIGVFEPEGECDPSTGCCVWRGDDGTEFRDGVPIRFYTQPIKQIVKWEDLERAALERLARHDNHTPDRQQDQKH